MYLKLQPWATKHKYVVQFPVVYFLLVLAMDLILSHELISAWFSLCCYTLAYYCFGVLPLMSAIFSLQELLPAFQRKNSEKFCLSAPLLELYSSVSENKSSSLNPVIVSMIGNGPCSFNSATSKCPIMSELIGCSG